MSAPLVLSAADEVMLLNAELASASHKSSNDICVSAYTGRWVRSRRHHRRLRLHSCAKPPPPPRRPLRTPGLLRCSPPAVTQAAPQRGRGLRAPRNRGHSSPPPRARPRPPPCRERSTRWALSWGCGIHRWLHQPASAKTLRLPGILRLLAQCCACWRPGLPTRSAPPARRHGRSTTACRRYGSLGSAPNTPTSVPAARCREGCAMPCGNRWTPPTALCHSSRRRCTATRD